MVNRTPGVVGRNLRRLRKAKGVTTRDLATVASVARQTIVGLELGYKGQDDTKISTLRRIAGALNCDIEDLLAYAAPGPAEGA